MSDIDSSFERIIQPGHDAIFPEYQLHLDRRQASVLEIFCRFEKAYDTLRSTEAQGYHKSLASREAASRYDWEVLYQPALGSLAAGAYTKQRDLKLNVCFKVDLETDFRQLSVTRPSSILGVAGPEYTVALSKEPHSAPRWALRAARKAGNLLLVRESSPRRTVEDAMFWFPE